MAKKKPSQAKPKKLNLLDEISNLAETKETFQGTSWAAWMQRSKPEEYSQVVEVVQDFLNNGKTARVFRTVTHLWRYLQGKDPDHPREPIFEASRDAFIRLLERVKDGKG